ncbi:hypothetical protein HDV06_001128 [Boothiomyces sp. JEL0866]|nr:hypothetical protein HDV06_001128 [Boothiomyces sp. JEL0866]
MNHDPWLSITIRQLNSLTFHMDEKKYYPLYNLILTLAFPPQEDFIVAPQTYPDDSRDTIDYSVEYDLFQDTKLICFVEIKPANHILLNSTRIKADLQMRKRFTQLANSFEIDKLIGICAIGKRCSVYYMNLNSNIVYPLEIDPIDPTVTEDLVITLKGDQGAPASRWNIDISTPEGRILLNDVFEDIRSLL